MSSELLFAQLKTAGVVVDPTWELDTMTPDALYSVAYDSASVVVGGGTDDAEVNNLFQALPRKLPRTMRDRTAACQQLCVVLERGLSCRNIEYNFFVFPEASRTKALMEQVAQAVGEHAERVATALADSEEAAALEAADDEEDVDGPGGAMSHIPVARKMRKSLGVLRKSVESAAPGQTVIRVAEGEENDAVKAEASLPFETDPLADPREFGEGATLVAQLTQQRRANASLIEYMAASRFGTASFEAARKRRLTAGSAASRTARFAAPVLEVVSGAEATTVAASSAGIGQSSLFGNAVDLDPRVAAERREAAENAASAEAAASAAVAELESTVEGRREKRQLDERGVYEQLKATKQRVADMKAVVKAQKARVRAAQEEIDEAEAKRDASTADWERRKAEAEIRQQLILDAADPATLENLDAQLDDAMARRETIQQEFETRLAKVAKKHTKLRVAAEELAALNADNQLVELRQACKALKRALRESRAESQSLNRQWQRCPKGIDRTKYARIVGDMSASLRKQQIQIEDVMRQIREQQERVESTRGKARDVYSTVEDNVYEQAKQEAFAKDAYPRIIELREAYASLIGTIEERGRTRREQHVVDARHAKLQKSVAYFDSADEGVSGDLAGLKDEIKQLQASIKQLQVHGYGEA